MRLLTTKQIDWTFKTVSTGQFTHGFHQYPARMHPEIAKRVIEKYATDPKSVILDPFMGSGGVLVESMLHGNNSIGIDLNPFAVLISKVKTTKIDSKKLQKIFEEIMNVSVNDYKNKTKFNNHPEKIDLAFWYPTDPIKKLPILKHHIMKIKNNDLRNFFLICFSLTVRRTSFQKNSVYKIYRMKPEVRTDFNPDTFKKFSEICQKNIQNMDYFSSKMDSNAKAYTILGDSRDIHNQFSKIPNEVLENGKAHLVVTSPPYGDHGTTVAYGQFSKHLGLWIDLKEKDELLSVDSKGLGGKKIINHHTLDSDTLTTVLKKVKKKDLLYTKKTSLSNRADDVFAFFYDLDLCLEQLSQSLKKGKSHLCFVVANRTVRREKILTDKILIELSKKYDFKYLETIHRDIVNKAMAVKNAPENISNYSNETMNKESIVLFKF